MAAKTDVADAETRGSGLVIWDSSDWDAAGTWLLTPAVAGERAVGAVDPAVVGGLERVVGGERGVAGCAK